MTVLLVFLVEFIALSVQQDLQLVTLVVPHIL